MVYKDQDLVKHGRDLPKYLHCGGKGANTQDMAFNFGVLDWSRLENWKSNKKPIMQTSVNNVIPQSYQQTSNNTQPDSCSKERVSTCSRPKGRDVKSQLSETFPAQTFANLQSPSDCNGKQAEQMLTSQKKTSSTYNRKYGSKHSSHDETKTLSSENTYDDDDLYISSHEDLPSSLKHSSLSKRFSFSIEKVAKNFSIKTSSAYKSVKSGLVVTYGSLHDLHDHNSKIANATNIIKSIPMRRLLKQKGHHSAEKIHQSNINLSSSPVYEKKPESSNPQAFLQLTIKNGNPFFKLVVDSSSNILAAGVTKLPSGNNDTSLTYTFYSLHEIKKKSNNLKNQVSKENGCGFDFNVMGHMKISSSYHAEFSGLERDLFVVRESVLCGSGCMLGGELAAIIVKNTSKESYGGIGSSESTVVILPGGSHSVPNSGEPSSLINRWRSGGACDCGGWDIGCELRVLTNQNETCESLNPSTSDRLDLCYQGSHNNKNAFSLAPLENGHYSLEYNASISLLQAFSICVAVISSQSLTHIFQVNHLQDANDFIKPILTRHQKVKSQTIVQT